MTRREGRIKEGPRDPDSLPAIEARINGYLYQWDLKELHVDYMVDTIDEKTKQRVVRAFLNRRSMERTMEDVLRDAFRRKLAYPYDVYSLEGKFSTLTSTGALVISYADTMVIEYRPLDVSDESVGRSFKYIVWAILGTFVFGYFLLYLLGKDGPE